MIIWYERYGSDKKRPIVNMIVAMICKTGILFLATIQIPEVIRYVYGPLPESICFLQSISRSSTMWQFLMYMNGIAMAKFAYVFFINNHHQFADEFWCHFLNLWITGFTAIFMFNWHISIKYQSIGYYICTSQDPTLALKNPPKVYLSMEIATAVIHAVSYVAIFYRKIQLKKAADDKFAIIKLDNLKQLDYRTISSIILNIVFLGLSAIGGFTVSKLNGILPSHFNIFPYYLIMYFRSLILPNITVIFFIVYFLLQPEFRKIIGEQLTDIYREHFIICEN